MIVFELTEIKASLEFEPEDGKILGVFFNVSHKDYGLTEDPNGSFEEVQITMFGNIICYVIVEWWGDIAYIVAHPESPYEYARRKFDEELKRDNL